jgi:quercetin 2,3-dioxygenase
MAGDRHAPSILYLHVKLEAGGALRQPVPPAFNCFAYVIAGAARFGDHRAERNDTVLFSHDPGDILVEADEGPVELLLIGGLPLGEPVARHGPFVMNTEEEIRPAIRDLRGGRFGVIDRR